MLHLNVSGSTSFTLRGKLHLDETFALLPITNFCLIILLLLRVEREVRQGVYM